MSTEKWKEKENNVVKNLKVPPHYFHQMGLALVSQVLSLLSPLPLSLTAPSYELGFFPLWQSFHNLHFIWALHLRNCIGHQYFDVQASFQESSLFPLFFWLDFNICVCFPMVSDIHTIQNCLGFVKMHAMKWAWYEFLYKVDLLTFEDLIDFTPFLVNIFII